MKKALGALNCLYPMPTTLVGAHLDGRPTYITMAHMGIMDHGTISLGMNKRHATNDGIRENRTFSVNLPTAAMIEITDYCGLVSAREVDKSGLFEAFYGELGTAPMIRECPVNMECRLVQTVDFPRHDVFVGEIVSTYADEEYLTDGAVDFGKLQPILFVMNDRSYWSLGPRLAKAWDVGKPLVTGR